MSLWYARKGPSCVSTLLGVLVLSPPLAGSGAGSAHHKEAGSPGLISLQAYKAGLFSLPPSLAAFSAPSLFFSLTDLICLFFQHATSPCTIFSLETCHVPACFKTGLSQLKAITDPLLDPLQLAYRANRSVDAVNMALHFTLQHLDSPGTYARILFVDFSSALNTIIPALLHDKLSQLSVPDSTCRWITDFLSDRRQHVKLGRHVSDTRTINTGSAQGRVLSPLLFSLYTNSCTSSHQSVKLLKFADDTILIGLISDGDESVFRWEIDQLVNWCRLNNLELNAL
ncbi:uncharacterized protein LOC126398998 [Epinephelus moara]|uniref:uncharacterized protein LOC126398998 n=1 Tax=Epinephelus moara TaxID=300413 RepID=UPI00214F5577|nr:uncharacterized protein LOC126398998 [Epinephelus moara]